ncbi:MAG: Ig-like domain-containing protein [Planctomycetaceae bacterium]|nr:Ig-like domain-containing protein [Planctomycetaceae bacterium]
MMDRRNQTLPASIEILESLILMSASSIEGTDAGEWISGTSLDDAIQAGAGDDEIHSSMGHNLIDGGSGTDTLVVYEGFRADFHVQRFSDGRVLVEGPGLNGQSVINELQSVERIAFNDEMVLTKDLIVSDQTLNDQPDVVSAAGDSGDVGNDHANDQDSDLPESEDEGSERSGSAKSTSARSGSAKSASAKSVSDKSASRHSTSDKSSSGKSASEKSASEKSASEKSASEKSASEKSASEKSASEKSSSGKSAKSQVSNQSPQSASVQSATSQQTKPSQKSKDATLPSVTVESANLSPIARRDEYRVAADQSLVGNVLLNDADPDPDQLQVSLATRPQHGSVVLNRDGDFSYIPQQGFTGTDTFRYQLSDGRGGLTVGAVAIDVQPAERPLSAAPVAVDDSFRFEADVMLSASVSGNDSGVAGPISELRYELIDDVDSGKLDFYADGSFDYVASEPPTVATFRYRIIDSTGGVSVARVELIPSGRPGPVPQVAEPPAAVERVDPAPPVAELPAPLPPEPAPPEPPPMAVPVGLPPDADADVIAAAADEPLVVNVLQNDSDPDGDELVVVSHTQTEHGTVTVSEDGTLTYSADSGFTGIDFLYYSVSDGDQTDQATIIIHVDATGELPEGVSDVVAAEMVLSPIVFDLNEDGLIGVTGETTARDKSGITSIGRTVEFDLDADGRAESIEWIDGRGDGFLVDSSQIRGTDIDGRALFGDEGGRYANGFEKLELFDRDGNGLIEVQEFGRLRLWVDNGDGVLQAGELETLQRHDVFAIDTRMELTADGLMQSVAFVGNDAEILIEDVWFAEQDAEPEGAPTTDNPDNQDPDANPDLISVNANTDVVAQVLTNDRDVDGGTLRVVSHTRAIHGEVVVTDDGQLRYTPDTDFVGNDYVQYTISDGQGGTDTAIAVLQVRPVAAGVGQADGPDAGANGASVSGTISGTVWQDVNQNGLREDSEQGRGDGVFVSLLNGQGVVTQSVHTGADGEFTFDDLADGRYSIRINQSSLPSVSGQQAQLTWQDVNSDFLNAVDSDFDQQTGESSVVSIGSSQSVVQIDAGYYFA